MTNLRTSQYAGPRNSIDIASYISGYFDGEGCFSVAIGPRPKIRVGWEVRPSASVSQNADHQVLQLVAEYFSCGSIRPDPGDHTVEWETRRLDDIVGIVLPHFDRYPWISGNNEMLNYLQRSVR